MTAAVKLMSSEVRRRGVTVNCVAPGATATERRARGPRERARRPPGRRVDGPGRGGPRAIPAGRGPPAGGDRGRGRVPRLGRGELRQRHGADRRRRTYGDECDGRIRTRLRHGRVPRRHHRSGARRGGARRSWCTPTSWSRCPPAQVHNPTELRIAGRLPTTTFEIFRQTIPPGLSSDMQRHHHETVHYVISGDGHSEIEDENRERGRRATSSTRRRGPGTATTTTRPSDPVEFLTIENSRLLGLLGVGRRQSAGPGHAGRGPRPCSRRDGK